MQGECAYARWLVAGTPRFNHSTLQMMEPFHLPAGMWRWLAGASARSSLCCRWLPPPPQVHHVELAVDRGVPWETAQAFKWVLQLPA